MYNKKYLLPTDYGAKDENTLKIGLRQQSPMNPALKIKMSKRIAIASFKVITDNEILKAYTVAQS